MRTYLLALLPLVVATPAFAEMDAATAQKIDAMQAQINQLQTELQKLKTTTAPVPAVTSTVNTSDVKVSLNPGPQIESADGANSFRIGGFVQGDAAFFDDDKRDQPDGALVRRARLNVSGTFAKDFSYRLENDFANNTSALTDIFIQYNGFKPLSITLGQFKEPIGLEWQGSDLITTFLERGSTIALLPERSLGLGLGTSGQNWSLNAGAFRGNTGTSTSTANTDDQQQSYTARGTWAVVNNKEDQRVVHVGAGASYRIPNQSTDTVRIQSRPLTRQANAFSVDTGNITSVDDQWVYNAELAYVEGPFAAQAEYTRTDINRTGALVDPDFNAYYGEMSYFLTGESRSYNASRGRFEATKVKSPFSINEKQWGAWQVMARYGLIDLNDTAAGINGGQMRDYSFGVRWMPIDRLMLMTNYSRINTDNRAVTANDDPGIWMLRMQVDF